MTRVVGQDKMSPEDTLAHYGVKGMKWGRSKGDDSSGGSKKSKPTSDEIKSARVRVAAKERRLATQADKLNLSTGKKQATEAKKFSDLHTDYLKDPDRATAARMTKGEKVALSVLAVGLPGVGTGVAAGTAGSQRLVRRSIEKQQRKLNDS